MRRLIRFAALVHRGPRIPGMRAESSSSYIIEQLPLVHAHIRETRELLHTLGAISTRPLTAPIRRIYMVLD